MMVVSNLNACALLASGGHPQGEPAGMRWISPTNSPDDQQQNCILNFSNSQQSSSPLQNGEESCYGSDNGGETAARSSGSEEATAFSMAMNPGRNASMMAEYSNSENGDDESLQSPLSYNNDDDGGGGGNGPRKNGSKSKMHKCRTCEFSTTSKEELWIHSEIHMKAEKVLRCPECTFVTEYKHHLDFHISNHQGAKPYKCDKCNYDCVNKSMLKSHLKSHSNVYQYRCANCAYRTKYCHSLKIHLRKYGHEPGVVLDSEGNLNPHPIIDVYGNRRGPKPKQKRGHHHHHYQQQKQLQLQLQQQQQEPMPPTAMNGFPNFPWVGNFLFNDRVPILPALLNPLEVKELMFPDKNQAADLMFNNSDKGKELLFHDKNQMELMFGNDKNHAVMIFNNDKNQTKEMMFHNNNDKNQANLHFEESAMMKLHSTEKTKEEYDEPLVVIGESSPPLEDVPLNLTITSTPPPPPVPPPPPQPEQTPVVKNRRKGIACKLKRVSPETDTDTGVVCKLQRNSLETSTIPSSSNPASATPASNPVTFTTSAVAAAAAVSAGAVSIPIKVKSNEDVTSKLFDGKPNFYCEYCDIVFFNQIMFTMHRGCHGYSDPFTCNRCGKKTPDSVAFYAHVISSAHV